LNACLPRAPLFCTDKIIVGQRGWVRRYVMVLIDANMIFFTATEAISFICEQERLSCFAPHVSNADLVRYAESIGWKRPP